MKSSSPFSQDILSGHAITIKSHILCFKNMTARTRLRSVATDSSEKFAKNNYHCVKVVNLKLSAQVRIRSLEIYLFIRQNGDEECSTKKNAWTIEFVSVLRPGER